MKTTLKHTILTMLAVITVQLTMGQNGKQVFQTPQEAAQKGKNDLLAVINLRKGTKVDVDTALLRQSTPGKPIKWFELDFNGLLQNDNVNSLKQIAKNEKNVFVPLQVNGRVVTVIEVKSTSSGWVVAGLGNAQVATDVNAVLNSAGNAEITLYEVPNLQQWVYAVNSNEGEKYYVEYDRFNLKQGVELPALYNQLKKDAEQFNKEYGPKLKDGLLVK